MPSTASNAGQYGVECQMVGFCPASIVNAKQPEQA